MNLIISDSEIEIIAAVIDKIGLAQKYADPWSPYELALQFCMERLLRTLLRRGQEGRLVHVIFESRGKKEDAELELCFRRIADNQEDWGYVKADFSRLKWNPIFIDKKSNSSGIQIADLIARPIGLKTLRPTQPNRAYDILEKKLLAGGLKRFP